MRKCAKKHEQINVFQTSNPDKVINRDTNNEFNKSFKSNHEAFTVNIEAQTDKTA